MATRLNNDMAVSLSGDDADELRRWSESLSDDRRAWAASWSSSLP